MKYKHRLEVLERLLSVKSVDFRIGGVSPSVDSAASLIMATARVNIICHCSFSCDKPNVEPAQREVNYRCLAVNARISHAFVS